MTETSTYSLQINSSFEEQKLSKGIWIVLVHAMRIPPHVGMIFNGKYCSLNITGQETDISLMALLKLIEQQKIKSVFVQLKKHPVFSSDYLHEYFKIQVSLYPRVQSQSATCFTPVRTFFCENYALHAHELEYLYQLFPELYLQDVIDEVFTLNMEDQLLYNLPLYSTSDIEEKLKNVSRKS